MHAWSPHQIRADGMVLGYSSTFLDRLIQDGSRLFDNAVPVVFTLGHLALLAGESFVQLKGVVNREGDEYETFNLRKRNGGWRRICIPSAFLLSTQRWIDQHILRSKGALASLHPASHAYAPGDGVKRHAARHCGARWLVKVDVKEFFETISERQVYWVFRSFGYSALLSFELARICTRAHSPGRRYRRPRWMPGVERKEAPYFARRIGHLPQGAPTSPMLANYVCRKLDAQLQAAAQKAGATYTRYADDLVFSASELDRPRAVLLIRQVRRVLAEYGFRANSQKTAIVAPGARKIVTGLVVNSGQPQLQREFKDRLRQHLYYSIKFGLMEHCRRCGFRSTLGFLKYLGGIMRYARHVEPQFAAKYESQYQQLVREFPLPSLLARAERQFGSQP